jgi:hypothetical protein
VHPYVSEAHNRTTLYLVLGALATGGAYAVSAGLAKLGISLPWWVETPSVLWFYGVLWKFFEVRAWRWPLSCAAGWTEAPDLAGIWDATVHHEYAGVPGTVSGRATIKQTATNLSIVVEFPASRSHSVAAVMQKCVGDEMEVIYQFVNQPQPHATRTMEMHRGTSWLTLRSPNKLVGEYFSGRGRRQMGQIEFARRGVPPY